MKSSGEIRFDLQSALAQAQKLDGVTERIERKVTRPMDGTAQELNAVWKGENANLFVKKELDLRRQITQTAQDLRGIARDIRATARRMYDAEMEALRIAQKRDS